ncbi:unnamed protein product, partial [Urochloa humidicola]
TPPPPPPYPPTLLALYGSTPAPPRRTLAYHRRRHAAAPREGEGESYGEGCLAGAQAHGGRRRVPRSRRGARSRRTLCHLYAPLCDRENPARLHPGRRRRPATRRLAAVTRLPSAPLPKQSHRAYTVVGENVECRLESLTRLKREDKMGLLWSCKHLIKILVPKIFLETVPNYFIPIGRRLHS